MNKTTHPPSLFCLPFGLACLFAGLLACLPPAPHETTPRETSPHEASIPEHPPPPVGQFCEKDQDCKAPLSCETNVPQGYCTRSCQKSLDCPAQSLCVRVTFSNGLRLTRCLNRCQQDLDCRKGFFCYQPQGASQRICFPVF